MNDTPSSLGKVQKLSLDPVNPPKGTMERLMLAEAHGLATALHAKAAAKPVPADLQFHRWVLKIGKQQASYAPIRNPLSGAATALLGQGLGFCSAPQMAKTAALTHSASLPGVGRVGLGVAALTRIARHSSGMAGMSDAVYQQLGKGRAWGGSQTGAGGRPGAISRLGGSSLPSIAPIGSRNSGSGALAGQNRGELSSMSLPPALRQTSESAALARRQGQNPAGVAPVEDAAVTAAAREHEVKLAVSEYLDRQSRLPPSGGAGFDPRLSPAWAGVKLPN